MKFFNNMKYSLTKYKHSYGDQIVRTVITSKFAKSKINSIVIMLSTILLRNILCVVFCIAFHTGSYYFDFILETIISILCLFSSTFIYDGLHGKKEVFYKYTKYYINNYTPVNYRKWKRNIILPIALSFIVSTYFYEINNEYIRYLVWQSLLIYFIMDVIEHNKIKIVSDYLYAKNPNPKTIVKKEMVIEHGFMTMNKDEYKIRKAKEMYDKRMAYIEEQKRKEQKELKAEIINKEEDIVIRPSLKHQVQLPQLNMNIFGNGNVQKIEHDISCSSSEEEKDENHKYENNTDIEVNNYVNSDEEMKNLEATYESISYNISD